MTFALFKLLKSIIIIEFMSINHHYPCSEVWAQGDLRRASCEAGRAACASEVFPCLDCNVVVVSDPSTPTDTLAAAAQILAEEVPYPWRSVSLGWHRSSP